MKKDVGDIKDEELENVAGGEMPFVSTLTTNKPHCRSCGKVLPLIKGTYVCDSVGCKEMGVRKGAKEIAWY